MTMHSIVKTYLREKLQEDIGMLLDDPHGFGDRDEIHVLVRKLTVVSHFLDTNFNSLMVAMGSDFEVQRLRRLLEAGEDGG